MIIYKERRFIQNINNYTSQLSYRLKLSIDSRPFFLNGHESTFLTAEVTSIG
jgi:hypothetical protein